MAGNVEYNRSGAIHEPMKQSDNPPAPVFYIMLANVLLLIKIFIMKNSKNQNEKPNVSGSKSKDNRPNRQVWEQSRTDRNKDRYER